jgi:thioredoxin-dependent peroxiredoxin
MNLPAPHFTAKNQDDRSVSLANFANKWLVLYFYPRDNTPGCTTEAIDFSQLLPDFQKLNAAVVGVSPDSIESHCKFISKKNLSIELLSDSDRQIAEAYQVWGLKKFMGKEYTGVIRSTFLISPDGKIIEKWTNVKVKEHARIVLEKLTELVAAEQ